MKENIFYPSSNVRIAYFSIYAIIILVLFISLLAKMMLESSGDIDLGEFGLILLFTSPIWLMVFVPAFVWIYRTKVIDSIEFNEESQHIIITNNKGVVQKWPYRELVFSVSSSDFHYKMVFYRRVRATRGHFLNKKVNKLLAFVIPLGWSINDLNNIESFMRSREIPSVIVESNEIIDDLFE